jgi:hypothetical protein
MRRAPSIARPAPSPGRQFGRSARRRVAPDGAASCDPEMHAVRCRQSGDALPGGGHPAASRTRAEHLALNRHPSTSVAVASANFRPLVATSGHLVPGRSAALIAGRWIRFGNSASMRRCAAGRCTTMQAHRHRHVPQRRRDRAHRRVGRPCPSVDPGSPGRVTAGASRMPTLAYRLRRTDRAHGGCPLAVEFTDHLSCTSRNLS